MSENLLVQTDGPICTIAINRPKALNALNAATLSDLERTISTLSSAEVRALIITGAGEKAFVAGADIAEMKEYSPAQAAMFSALGHRVFSMIEALPFVTIAAVNGFALGGGLELAMACDLLYGAENAKVGQPEVNLAVIPGFGGTQRLQRLVGAQFARQMIFTGDIYDAATARARGLFVEVFPKEELLAKVREVAQKVVAKGPLAIASAKHVMARGADLDLASANVLEQQTFGLLFDTKDQREGMAAFLEKRAAAFTGE